jgi:predicted amidophosphoribosyltransferase
MLRAAASLVAPPLCALCADPCEYLDSICRHCERSVSRLRPVRGEVDGLEIWSAASYDGVAREIVTKMKFAQRLTLAEVAAERMLRTVGAGRDVYCVPVPPSPARERARGFDLASALSRLITRGCRGQTIPCLERDDGPRQVGRGRGERKSDPPKIRPINVPLLSDDVWLVDDVATTGATLLACADVLLHQHGAKRVRGLTFARADN